MIEYKNLSDKEKYFNVSANVITKEQLDAIVDELKEKAAVRTDHIVFRGINEAKHRLFNSMQRQWMAYDMATLGIDPLDRVESVLSDYRKNDNTLAKYLKRIGVIKNDWLVLSLLQHHGAPSPLLDFSRNPLAALFFACNGATHRYSDSKIDNYISIYYYKEMEVARDLFKTITTLAEEIVEFGTTFDEVSIWNKDLSFNEILKTQKEKVVLLPSHTNATIIRNGKGRKVTKYTIANLNLTSQDGEFVCNMDMDKPLEEKFCKGDHKYISCINIHKGLVDYAVKKHLGGSIEAARKKFFISETDMAKEAESKLFSLV